jgi:hypothetical protein
MEMETALTRFSSGVIQARDQLVRDPSERRDPIASGTGSADFGSLIDASVKRIATMRPVNDCREGDPSVAISGSVVPWRMRNEG